MCYGGFCCAWCGSFVALLIQREPILFGIPFEVNPDESRVGDHLFFETLVDLQHRKRRFLVSPFIAELFHCQSFWVFWSPSLAPFASSCFTVGLGALLGLDIRAVSHMLDGLARWTRLALGFAPRCNGSIVRCHEMMPTGVAQSANHLSNPGRFRSVGLQGRLDRGRGEEVLLIGHGAPPSANSHWPTVLPL